MRLSTTLSRYIGRQFIVALGGVYLALLTITLLLDTLELARRAGGKEEATFGVILQLSLLKLPGMAQEIAPFAILFGSMLAFWRLTRSHELVVARSAGVSVWQFLLPGLVIVFLIGIIKITVFSPLTSVLLGRFEQLENKYLSGKSSLLTVSESGLWLRQPEENGHSVIHAQRVSPSDMTLHDVIIFRFADIDRFVWRIDASEARLLDGKWDVRKAWLNKPETPPEFLEKYSFATELTADNIQEGFASPEAVSFWDLPKFISLLEAAGFSALSHRLYFQSLLADPFLLCAMVLIAATFTLRPVRRGGVLAFISVGVFAGFLLFFLSDLIFALGLSGRIPISLAAWTPAGVSILLGVSMLFHLEDG